MADPKVYLNTSQTLTGATQLTVTGTPSDTSITFTDAKGGPVGSLYLGVENVTDGGGDANTGWIAVDVANSGAGAVSIPLPTASGTTAFTATGAPSITLPTAAGTAEVGVITTGAPTIPLPTTTGAAEVIQTGTGAPTIPLITASGSTPVLYSATGAPSVPLITATGAEIRWPRVYLNTTETKSGATEMTVTAASSTSITFNDPVGAPTGSLYLGVENQVDDSIGWIAVTVSATTADQTATGSPSIPLITSAGSETTSAAATPDIYVTGGAVDLAIPDLTTSAYAEVQPTSADGAVSIPVPTTTGATVATRSATGAPTIPLITASGYQARPATTGRGARKKRKPRYIVEINNEYIEVASVQAAQEMLQQVRDLAEESAEQDVKATAPPRVQVKTGSGKAPKSKTIQAATLKTQRAVDEAYNRAVARRAIDAEISKLLLAKIAAEDEEEEAILALLLS